jgi:cupin 2 domain-containing protein
MAVGDDPLPHDLNGRWVVNIFTSLAPPGLVEQIDLLAAGAGVRIERIVSHGHCSAPDFWYDQDDDEWVLVVQGSGTIAFDDGETVKLCTGDHLLIPAHRRHRVMHTEATTIWIAVFIPPRPA